MSRVANSPVNVPEKVEVNISANNINVKGPLGELNQHLTGDVSVEKNDNVLTFKTLNSSKFAKSMSGTLRALVANMVKGVSEGFEKKTNFSWCWIQSPGSR
jgi:large subunit ribosomal protein L6